jgi:hypothetical protein
MSPQFSGSKLLLAIWFHGGFLLGLFFDPKDGADIFIRYSVKFQKIELFITIT